MVVEIGELFTTAVACALERIDDKEIHAVCLVSFILVIVEWTIFIIFVHLSHLRATTYDGKKSRFRAFGAFIVRTLVFLSVLFEIGELFTTAVACTSFGRTSIWLLFLLLLLHVLK